MVTKNLALGALVITTMLLSSWRDRAFAHLDVVVEYLEGVRITF